MRHSTPLGAFEDKLAAMLGMDLSQSKHLPQPAEKLKTTGVSPPPSGGFHGPPPPYAEAASPTTVAVGVQTTVNSLAAQAEHAQQRASAAELHGQVARLQAELRATKAGRASQHGQCSPAALQISRASTGVVGRGAEDASVGQQLRLAIRTLARMLLETEADRALTDGQRHQVLRLLELTAANN